MINKIIILLFVVLSSVFPDSKLKFYRQYEFALKSQDHLEGFEKSIGKNDFSYHSLRHDVTDALLTRCTDGQMAIEWLTQEIPDPVSTDGLWFSLIAAVQMTNENLKFDVFINDIKRFEIISGNDQFKRYENPEGGILEFTAIELDQHNDAHGYMSFYLPSKWIGDYKQCKIKIIGESAGSNTWIIIYKASDVINYVRELVKYETWLDIELTTEKDNSQLKISAPKNYINKSLEINIGSNDYRVTLYQKDDAAAAELKVSETDLKNKTFVVSDESAKLIEIPSLQEQKKYQKLLRNCILINEVGSANELTKISCKRIYKPHAVNNLLKLYNSNLSSGKINLMNSSHQDIAWMDSPEKCVIERDTMLLTPLYEKAMLSDTSYRFDVEDALMLKEFVQRHPDKREGIKQLLNDGKISCGSSFIQPYEEMYSGESLVRQFYFGKKWLKDEFGYDSKVYWNVDVPGRVLQMPQILKKSGTDYMVISRFERGIYNWYSPDGSYVTAYSPGHYADAFMPLHKDVFDAANYLAESSLYWEKYYSGRSANNLIPVLSDWDMSPAKDYSHIISNWESIDFVEGDNDTKIPITLPKFKIRTADEFLEDFVKSASNIPKIEGERPPVWLYIHGPSHYQAIKLSREADILLPAAEKFASINALLLGSMTGYPKEKLDAAWEAKIYPDHGWGGKEGDITDEMFRRKFEYSHNEAASILERSLSSIASNIVTDRSNGVPVIVFNSLNWKRTDPVKVKVKFDKGDYKSFSIIDAEGGKINSQISVISEYEDKSVQQAEISFIAADIPPTGYKTYYITRTSVENKQIPDPYESKFFKLTLTDGGIESIYDKELERELIDPTNFNAGEVFTMNSEGNGAGEFADIQQPTMLGFDRTGNYKTKWILLENGPVYSSFKFRQQIRNAVVEQRVILYKEIKKMDFHVSLLNWEGVLYREYRMALPLNINEANIAYETAFGVSQVGKDEIDGAAGERYTTPCEQVHPRGIENWIGAYNNQYGVTLSSSVAVADYIDPTSDNSGNVLLQPILLASRRSCHELGNEYLQTGDHHFKFSLTSHTGGWENGFRFGKEANENLFVLVNPQQYKYANLTEEHSFFSVDGNNVIISTIKKAEDDDAIIIRMYDILGHDEEIELKSSINVSSAFKTNLIEEEGEKLKNTENGISLNLGKYSIETIKILPLP